MREIGVLVVHGMGEQNRKFADAFIQEMNERLVKAKVPSNIVHWEPAFWADLLTGRENKLWADMTRNHELDWAAVRKFFIHAMADAVAYRPLDDGEVGVYEKIHQRIRDHLGALRERAGSADLPVVVMAHSLGSVIMSNYIWDEQVRPAASRLGRNPVECMQTLAGLVTFGSNIPLFTLAHDEVKAIGFPAKGLDPVLAAKAKWLNFYDKDDVLGYPLKPLSASYKATVSRDIAISAGGLFTSWNPVAHSDYWTDDDFTVPVTKLIASLAKA